MVALLLVSMIGAPFMSAPVTAQEETEDGWKEQLAEGGCAAGGVLVTYFSECSVEYGDVDGSTPEQVWWDVYSDSVFMTDSRDQTITEKMSYVEQTQGIALAEAKIEIVRCMNNGNPQSVCEDQARNKVTETFATVQKSIYVSQNREMKHWQIMSQQINQTDNLSPTSVYPYESNEADWDTEFQQVEVQLYDGQTMNVTKGYFSYVSGDGGDTYYIHPYYYNGQNPWEQGGFGVVVTGAGTTTRSMNVIAPDGQTSIALDGGAYKEAITTLDSKHQSALSSVHPMADSIYSNYEPGEVSTQDVAGPLEIMVTSATENNPVTYRVLSAASAGYAVSDDAKTVKVKADFDNDGTIGTDETKTGIIYADPGAFPNNKISAGTTYEPSDTNGSVIFTSTPEGASPEDFPVGDKQFTVVEIYTSDGEQTNSMQLESNDFATTNTDDLNKQINDIEQQLEELENSYGEDSPTFGGLSGASSAIQSFLQEFGVALLGILALLAGAWFLK